MNKSVVQSMLILSLKVFKQKIKNGGGGNLRKGYKSLTKKIIKNNHMCNRISEAPYLSLNHGKACFSPDPGCFLISFLRKERSYFGYGNSQTNLQNENRLSL
jgi:hypothetical protein